MKDDVLHHQKVGSFCSNIIFKTIQLFDEWVLRNPKILQYLHFNIPYMFDCWADPVFYKLIPENTHLHRNWKYHCTSDLLFGSFGFGRKSKSIVD